MRLLLQAKNAKIAISLHPTKKTMTDFKAIENAPKNGDEIFAVCSDGVRRYCRWVGCSETEGYWETSQECTPLCFDPNKTLPHGRDGERLAYLMDSDAIPDALKIDRHEYAFECAEADGRSEPDKKDELNGFRRMIDDAIKADSFQEKAFEYMFRSL